MAAQIVLLEDFVRDLQLEGPFRLTWLVGAGMSASAGIPLAVDVTRRVILFKHLLELSLQDETWSCPWPSEKSHLTYNDFEQFLDWYELGTNQEMLLTQACGKLSKRPEFAGFDLDNPQCYPLVFANGFVSDKSHSVLTSLVRRASGVNIAHLALAGILKENPLWGHTVFTTNFDDLLLKACLSLNHTARVFGELKSNDRPSGSPTYPQIVHLHGRHTGYRLANTQEQFKQLDPNLKKGFLDHLRESYLVVVGYSGWDDMAMTALRDWKNDDTLVKGLFWVPYKSESEISAQTREFLDSCPPHKVKIIVNAERDLCADSFMLSMCKAINRKSGFTPFRKGVLQFAQQQHSFTLQQLERFPGDDPLSVLSDAEKALLSAVRNQPDISLSLLTQAAKKIAEDTPREVLAPFSLIVGATYYLLDEFVESEKHLLRSLENWSPESNAKDKNDGAARTCLLLGQIYLRQMQVEKAKEHFKFARRYADKNSDDSLRAWAFLGRSMVTFRFSPQAAKGYVGECEASVDDKPSLLLATRKLVESEILRSSNSFEAAKARSLEAFEIFEQLSCKRGRADACIALASVLIKEDDISKAKTLLDDAEGWYQELNDKLGWAKIEQARADACLADENYHDAIIHFEHAEKAFSENGFLFSSCSVLADIAKTKRVLAEIEQGDLESPAEGIIKRAYELNNKYAQHIFEELGLIKESGFDEKAKAET